MSGEAFRALFSDIISEVPSSPRSEGAGGEDMDAQRVAVVVEDDQDIRGLLADILEQAGFVVYTAGTGLEGIAAVEQHAPVVTTLDVSMDGFETAKRIRAVSETYIIMLTARSDEIDTLQGLQSGADDYITKPFRPRELRARIEAMMRRPRAGASTSDAAPAPAPVSPTPTSAPEGLTHRGLALDARTRVVTRDGASVELTRSEFDLLHALLEAAGAVVTKTDLAAAVRGEMGYGSGFVSEHDLRAIEVHMANLRRKLGDSPTSPLWIETVRGVGYRRTAA